MSDAPPTNPYAAATAVNTATSWWTPQDAQVSGTVDAHIDGLTAYAGNAMTMSLHLRGAFSRVAHGFLPGGHAVTAVGGGRFPEGVAMNAELIYSASSMMAYLSNLATAVMNVGSAAQVVADCYHSTDDLSAVDLSAVDYAFARPGAPAPADLPSGLGQTWLDQMKSQLPGQPDQSAPDAPGALGASGPPAANGSTSTFQDPVTGRTVSTTLGTDPATGTVRSVTTVSDPDGRVTAVDRKWENGQWTIESTQTTTPTPGGGSDRVTQYADNSSADERSLADGSEVDTTYGPDGMVTGVRVHGPQAPAPDPTDTETNQPYITVSQELAGQLSP